MPLDTSIVLNWAISLVELNITISSAPSKSKTIESELDTDKLDVSTLTVRTSAEPLTTSSIFILIESEPLPVEPLIDIDDAEGASITNSSSPPVADPLTTTFRSIDPAITFAATLETVTTDDADVSPFFPSTPAREKVAPPLEFKNIVIAPVAVPENDTWPPFSVTINVAACTSATSLILAAEATTAAWADDAAETASASTLAITVGFAACAASTTAFTAAASVRFTVELVSAAVLTAVARALVTSRPASPPPAALINPAT